MDEIKLYTPDDKLLLSTEVDDKSYRLRQIMGDNTFLIYFSLPEFINIREGSYCDYKAERYWLPESVNYVKEHSEHFNYTLKLEGSTWMLKATKFKFFDYLIENGAIVPTSSFKVKFALTATPHMLADLIVANLKLKYPQYDWKVGDIIDSDPVTFDFNHDFCFDVLAKYAKDFNSEWELDKFTLNFGHVEKMKDSAIDLSYGRDNGLLGGIQRLQLDSKKIVNRVYVDGGERNIDRSTYGNDTLLLSKNARLTYKGVEYQTDASGSYLERVKPLAGKEDSLDISKFYPKRVGTVTAVEKIDDSQGFYNIIDKDIPADLDYSKYVIADETMYIIFQTGQVAGDDKKFDVKYNHAKRRFELKPINNNGLIYPQGNLIPAVGDKYAVFNMNMPQQYIDIAEQEALQETVKYMWDNEQSQFSYRFTLDGNYAKRNWGEIRGFLNCGFFVKFSDPQFLPEAVDVRIVSVKEFYNDDKRPEITIANNISSQQFGAIINEIPTQEQAADRKDKDVISYAKRRYRETKETIEMLENSLLEFTEGISPITLNTMLALIGDEKLQYEFVTSKTQPQVKPSGIVYNQTDKKLVCPAGIIQHMTLGEKKLSSTHELSEFLFWNVKAYQSDVLSEKSTAYFLYIKASKTDFTDAVYVLSKDAIEMEGIVGYYHFLVATLNSEKDNYRSYTEWYGYSEISPRRMITNLIQSADAKTYFDLANNRLQISSLGGSILSPSGDSSVLEVDRGGYNSSKVYYVGDKVWYNGIAYVCISNASSTGTPDKDVAKWKAYAPEVNVGGINLLTNSSFENGLGMSAAINRASMALYTKEMYKGSNSVIVDTTASTSTDTGYNRYGLNINRGEYTFSAYLKAVPETSSVAPFDVRVVLLAEDYKYIKVLGTHSVTDEWTRFAGTFKLTSDLKNCRLAFMNKGIVFLIDCLQLEEGNKATAWSLAPDDVRALISEVEEKAQQAQIDAVNAQSSVNDLNTYVDGAFKDGVVSEAEAAAIATHLKNVSETMAQLEATYNKLYANTYLDGTAKTNLLNAKISLFGARDNLVKAINDAIADAKVTPAEKNNVNTKYDLFNSAITAFNGAVEDANKAIQTKLDAISKGYADAVKKIADEAQKAADNAQQTAQESKDRLNEWAKDSVISPTEKTALKQQAEDVKSEYQEVSAQASRYDLTTTTQWAEYYNSYTKAIAAFGKYTSVAPENITIDADYADIAAYYTKRQIILNLVATKSKEYADDLVSSLQIGGVNLLNDSSFEKGLSGSSSVNNSTVTRIAGGYKGSYCMKTVSPNHTASGYCWQSLPTITGKVYTVSCFVKAEAAVSGCTFGAYTGAWQSVKIKTVDIGTEWSRVDISFTATGANMRMCILKANATFFVDCVQLEEGNKATSWKLSQEDLNTQISEAEAQAKKAQEEAASAKDSVKNLNTYVDGAFKDGVISEAEAAAIATHLKNVSETMAQLEATYNKLYANTYLEGTAKTNLLNAKISLFGTRDNLVKAINDAIADAKVTPAEKNNVNVMYDLFNGTITTFNGAVEDANKAIQTKLDAISKSYAEVAKRAADEAQKVADAAQKTANDAQTTAQESKNRLNEWAKDSVISPTEKMALKQQSEDVKSEYQEVSAQAARYNLTTTTQWAEYYSSYTKAIAAFGKYTSAAPENITIDTDYADIAAYYTKRQAILNLVATKSKEYADDLVNNLQIGGLNLITNSSFENGLAWSASVNKAYVGLYTDDKYKGTQCVQVNTAGLIGDSGFSRAGLNLKKGQYALSGYIKAMPNSIKEAPFDVRISVLKGWTWGQRILTYTVTDQWTRFVCPFYLNEDFDGCRIVILNNDVAFLLDCLQLEEGNKATTWALAPEDINALIDEVGTLARQAQADADIANGLLSDISNDDILTPNEKQDVLKEWDIIKSERATVVAQAQNLGLNASNYTVAYNALNAYITPLLANMTVNSTIKGADFRTKFKTYYDAKIALLKDVTDKAKELADKAQELADAAKKKADEAETAANEANSQVQALEYLKKALAGSTTIEGGLLLTSMIQLGIIDAGKFIETAGINGTAKNDNDVVIWAGGTLAEAQAGNASTVIRLNGTSQLSSNSAGNRIIIDPTNRAITLKSDKDEVLGRWSFYSRSDSYGSNITLYGDGTGSVDSFHSTLDPDTLKFYGKLDHVHGYYGQKRMQLEYTNSMTTKIFSVDVADGVAPYNKIKWNVQGLPTSSAGLKAGDVYIDGNSNLKVVPNL